MATKRKITIYGKHFPEFFYHQKPEVRRKIVYVLTVMEEMERIPEKFFKHLEGTDGLYEIRIEFESNAYHIFCCFDRKNIVVLFNAFRKKSQKTPKQEIQLAERLKKEYESCTNS